MQLLSYKELQFSSTTCPAALDHCWSPPADQERRKAEGLPPPTVDDDNGDSWFFPALNRQSIPGKRHILHTKVMACPPQTTASGSHRTCQRALFPPHV